MSLLANLNWLIPVFIYTSSSCLGPRFSQSDLEAVDLALPPTDEDKSSGEICGFVG